MPLLDPASCPTVLGAAPQRVLLADVPGQDQYDARGEDLRVMARMLIGLQAAWAGRVRSWRLSGCSTSAPVRPSADPLGRRPQPTRAGRRHAARSRRPRRRTSAAVRGAGRCGIPDTLVHGDFHPGNVRGAPALPDPRLGRLRHRQPHARPETLARVLQRGRPAAARSTSGRASGHAGARVRCPPGGRAGRPLGPLFGAVVYQKFLDNIETTERPYHEGDPAHTLRLATSLAFAGLPR